MGSARGNVGDRTALTPRQASALIYDHLCVLYEGGDDLARKCATLVGDAVSAGLRWIDLANAGISPTSGVRFAEDVRANGIMIDATVLFDLNTPPVCISSVIEKLRGLGAQAVSDGYRGLLVLIDMSWMIESPSGLANHGELEAALHRLATSAPIRIASLYNRSIFPAKILLDALRTHATVLDGGAVCCNPHFLPPEIYLSGDAERKLERWLFTLRNLNVDLANAESGTDKGEASIVPAIGAVLDTPADDFAQYCLSNGDTRKAVAKSAPAVLALKRWNVRCLGDLRVYRHDDKPVEWNRCGGATYKTKTIFAYLLQKGAQGASVEEIADLLWPDAVDLTQSLNRLYHTIHCLRLALSPDLSSSRNSPYVVSRNRRYYLMLPEGTWIDVPVFEQFCRQGEKLLNAGDIDQSLVCHMAAERLYTGSLFSDIPVEYVENRETDWCWSQRFWLERIYLKMLTYTAIICRRRDDQKTALQYCERVLKIDPCAENAHQEAMRIYHDAGRRDAVERQFRLCRESLKRFEDRQPSASTITLARELML
jgi:two-component SAPR family response regulator